MDATANSTELSAPLVPQIQLGTIVRIPAVRQLLLLVGVALSVAVGFSIVLWSQAPSFDQLYSDMPEGEAGAVVEVLRAQGIEVKLNQSTGAVMVASDKIHDARMLLASQGMPMSTSSGMESVQDQSSFGVSQFMETARYQHALEAELSRTIKSLRSVQEARVHLAIPKQSAFIRDQQKPSASVLLHLFGGQQLDANQASSIINLVASSIPAMRPSDVTLIDQFGRLLSTDNDLQNDTMTANQFKITRELENNYRRRIEQLLMPLLGPGRVRAQVVADLDFTVSEQTRESFDPQRTAIRSEQISEEKRANGAGAEGIPGALSNTPPEAGGTINDETGGANAAVNSSRRSTRNFEVDKTISRTRAQSGTIRRLSVAVLVDDSASVDGSATGDAGAAEAATLTPLELERITALVRESVGFSAERGDTVEVVSAPFHEMPTMEEVDGPAIWEQPAVREIFKQSLGVLLVLVLAFGVVRPMLKNIIDPPQKGLTTLMPGSSSGGGMVGQLEGPSESGLSYQEKVAAARNITGHDPARVAQVVRKWINADG